MYLKFTNLAECENCIKEINKRMNLTSNITSCFTIPTQDTDGNYIINKPNNKFVNERKVLVRDVTIQNIEGTFETVEVVKKEFDEDDNDITNYDGNEYEIIKQQDLSTMFDYVEV